MKRFTGHKEKRGEFVDVKINAPELLAKEIKKKRMGRAWVSGVCDPYQAAEKRWKLTRRCLEILAENQWPVTIQTKSSLVLRDIDIFEKIKDIEVGFSIGTADEKIRMLFEPGASQSKKGFMPWTCFMIAPLLPGADGDRRTFGKVDHVLIDRLNYFYPNRIYMENNLEWAKEEPFFIQNAEELKEGLTAESANPLSPLWCRGQT